jgi:hypothetical protein
MIHLLCVMQIVNRSIIWITFSYVLRAISELKINLQKSELVTVGEVPNIEELAGILSCIISSFPMKYLGLPLGAPFKSRAIWGGVVERWKKGWLAGRRSTCQRGLTFIKSTLSSLPTYFLSLFPLPIGIARQLERLQRFSLGWSGLLKSLEPYSFPKYTSREEVCSRLIKPTTQAYHGNVGLLTRPLTCGIFWPNTCSTSGGKAQHCPRACGFDTM